MNLFVGLFNVFINIQTLIYSKYYFKTKIDEFKGYTLIKRRNKALEKNYYDSRYLRRKIIVCLINDNYLWR